MTSLVGTPTQGIDYEIGIEVLAADGLIRILNEKLKHKAQLVLFGLVFQTVISSGGDRCFLKWQEICKAECYSTYCNCFINIVCVYSFYLLACGTSYFKWLWVSWWLAVNLSFRDPLSHIPSFALQSEIFHVQLNFVCFYYTEKPSGGTGTPSETAVLHMQKNPFAEKWTPR